MSADNLDDLGKEMEEALKGLGTPGEVKAAGTESPVAETGTPAASPAAVDNTPRPPVVSELFPKVEGAAHGLDFILDIPLTMSVELGRTRMFVREVCQLGQGSIIELNKTSEEFLDILVNGRVIAKGEVVVVNDKFGIRIMEIITPQQRIEQLR